MYKVTNKKIVELSISPFYETIYYLNNRQRELLKISIVDAGKLLEPIVVNDKNQIISGVQRFKVYQELGWESIPTRCLIAEDEEDELFQMIAFNRHKDKTMQEIWNEIQILERRWKKRQGERTDLKDVKSEEDKLSTRARIALHLNVTESQVQKIKLIAEKDPKQLNLICQEGRSLHEVYMDAIGKERKPSVPKDYNQGENIEAVIICCPNCQHKF